MTTAAENEILTRTGPGTPMGELMRQYWVPAAQSSELAADGEPMRLMLLGEKLIAFRDTSGRIGVMDHRCPHRCASFFFGRNEENGITCTYHGWKFDTDGNCVDMANVPAHQDFKEKVKAKAYKAAERNGLIWVYMGKKKKAPPLPAIEACLFPEGEVQYTFISRECNWLQSAEGEWDTSHFGFLHFGAAKRKDFGSDIGQYAVNERAPEYKVKNTDYGAMYGAYRPGDRGKTYWRVAHFLFPFWSLAPLTDIGENFRARAWVPIDDEHSMQIMIDGVPLASRALSAEGALLPGASRIFHYEPRTTDWYGRYRRADNMSNDYNINRDLQRSGVSYTGIDGIQLQDQAIQESMEPIVDRTFERLAPSDIMISQIRRRLIRAARAYKKDGTLPKSVKDPAVYAGARGGYYQAAKKDDWQEAYKKQLAKAPLRLGKAQAAE